MCAEARHVQLQCTQYVIVSPGTDSIGGGNCLRLEKRRSELLDAIAENLNLEETILRVQFSKPEMPPIAGIRWYPFFKKVSCQSVF